MYQKLNRETAGYSQRTHRMYCAAKMIVLVPGNHSSKDYWNSNSFTKRSDVSTRIIVSAADCRVIYSFVYFFLNYPDESVKADLSSARTVTWIQVFPLINKCIFCSGFKLCVEEPKTTKIYPMFWTTKCLLRSRFSETTCFQLLCIFLSK